MQAQCQQENQQHSSHLVIGLIKRSLIQICQSQLLQINLLEYKFFKKGEGHFIFIPKVLPFSKKGPNSYLGKKLIRIRQTKPLKSFIDRIYKNATVFENTFNNSNCNKIKEQAQDKRKENLLDANVIDTLFGKVYAQFLQKITKNVQDKAALLPEISQAIVRQQVFQLRGQDESKLIRWVVQEIIKFKIQKQQLVLKNSSSWREIIRQKFLDDENEIHINEIILEPNLLQSYSNQMDKSGSWMYLFFQIKPKTILPDIYSKQLLQQFIDRYQELFNRYIRNNKNKQIQKHSQDKSKNPTFEKMISLIKKSSSIKQSQLFKFNIQSTRWFKKNCLLSVKKNQNPYNFYHPIFPSSNNSNKLTIDFYKSLNLQNIRVIKKGKQIDCIKIEEATKQMSQHKQMLDKMPKAQTLLNKINGQINAKNDQLTLLQQILCLQLISYENDQKPMDTWHVAAHLRSCLAKSGEHIEQAESTVSKSTSDLLETLNPAMLTKAAALRALLTELLSQAAGCAGLTDDPALLQALCYLVSLTWRDISLMLAARLSSSQSDLNLNIIDFSLKSTHDIHDNVNKDLQYLLYYYIYCHGQQ